MSYKIKRKYIMLLMVIFLVSLCIDTSTAANNPMERTLTISIVGEWGLKDEKTGRLNVTTILKKDGSAIRYKYFGNDENVIYGTWSYANKTLTIKNTRVIQDGIESKLGINETTSYKISNLSKSSFEAELVSSFNFYNTKRTYYRNSGIGYDAMNIRKNKSKDLVIKDFKTRYGLNVQIASIRYNYETESFSILCFSDKDKSLGISADIDLKGNIKDDYKKNESLFKSRAEIKKLLAQEKPQNLFNDYFEFGDKSRERFVYFIMKDKINHKEELESDLKLVKKVIEYSQKINYKLKTINITYFERNGFDLDKFYKTALMGIFYSKDKERCFLPLSTDSPLTVSETYKGSFTRIVFEYSLTANGATLTFEECDKTIGLHIKGLPIKPSR